MRDNFAHRSEDGPLCHSSQEAPANGAFRLADESSSTPTKLAKSGVGRGLAARSDGRAQAAASVSKLPGSPLSRRSVRRAEERKATTKVGRCALDRRSPAARAVYLPRPLGRPRQGRAAQAPAESPRENSWLRRRCHRVSRAEGRERGSPPARPGSPCRRSFRATRTAEAKREVLSAGHRIGQSGDGATRRSCAGTTARGDLERLR